MRFAESQTQVAVALVVQPVARARLPVVDGPRLSQSHGGMLRKIQITDEGGERRTIQVPVERPLRVTIVVKPSRRFGRWAQVPNGWCSVIRGISRSSGR
jgi:hypothetical protein